jgi:hypothetical protein
VPSRRSFLTHIATLCGAAGVAPDLLEQVGAAELIDDNDAVRILIKAIDIYGAEDVAREIVAIDGPVDAREILRRLNRVRQRSIRQRKASERRQRHAGDEVLYRGPLVIHQEFQGRECRSAVRHRVQVGKTDRDYVIEGIGIPASIRPRRESLDVDGIHVVRDAESVDTRSLTIPAGSRVLIDLRRGIYETMACEVVRTGSGQIRLHLWVGATSYEADGEPPRLRGGVVYETTGGPAVGLLGLPL